MGSIICLIEGAKWIFVSVILFGLTEGQCLHEKIQQCANPFLILWNKDSPQDFTQFVQTFTNHKIQAWCSNMSVVEICLTKLINCTGDNEVEIEAILNTANYICHTEDLGEVEKQRKCVFENWNSTTKFCYEKFIREWDSAKGKAICNMIECYVECTKKVTEERCPKKDAAWLQAILDFYILRQFRQYYQCDFVHRENGRLSATAILLIIFLPLIIIVTSITMCVIARHRKNQKQIKKSITSMSLVSQQSCDSYSTQVSSDGKSKKRKKENLYAPISVSTTCKDKDANDDQTNYDERHGVNDETQNDLLDTAPGAKSVLV